MVHWALFKFQVTNILPFSVMFVNIIFEDCLYTMFILYVLSFAVWITPSLSGACVCVCVFLIPLVYISSFFFCVHFFVLYLLFGFIMYGFLLV